MRVYLISLLNSEIIQLYTVIIVLKLINNFKPHFNKDI